jgi:hypothetical protein
MLGYHVHEKAALGIVVPAALTAVANRKSARDFVLLVIVSTYALFPLLLGLAEYPIKVCSHHQDGMDCADYEISKVGIRYLSGCV